MRVYFKLFITALIFTGVVCAVLSYGNYLLSYMAFMKPGLDEFFILVGGDNPILKIIVFFVFWFVVIFGFSWISYIVLNTYIWTTNVPFEKKNPLRAVADASKEQVAILFLAIDFVVLGILILFANFKEILSALWLTGDIYMNRDLVYFWSLLFVVIYTFLLMLRKFMEKIHEVEKYEEHLG